MISAHRIYLPSIPPLSRSLYLLKRTTFLLFCILLSQRLNSYCHADIVHIASDSKSDSANSIVSANNVSSNQLFDKVLALQTTINNETSPYCYPSHSGTKDALKKNKWSKYVGNDLKIIIYPFCLITKELGNKLGNYFTELACAKASGVHFMTVHKQFNATGAKQGSVLAARSSDKLLIDYLPDIWLNPDPADPLEASDNVEKMCKCTRYCWGNGGAPWVNNSAFIGLHMLTAIKEFKATISPETATTVSLDTDFSNAKIGEVLPLVPDVTIQYRCGDNIGFSYMYGILPFTAFKPRIPKGSKYIYVLSDHPSRAMHSQFTSKCQVILKALFIYLQESNPTSTVVVKRGGDLFLDYIRMAYSKVLICSASTYCFWPALANVQNGGDVHFPLTSLIAGADTLDLAPRGFGDRFHWINETSIISDFRKIKPWTLITDILAGNMQMPT